ncbi:MAG: hypothetical protein Q9198_004690, partial [Flavoplaca austrocitrina]
MEDARSDRVASPPNEQAPDAVRVPPSTLPNFDQEVPDNTQLLLQTMAQDASNQLPNTTVLPAHRQDEQSASTTLSDQALVNGHVPPLANGETGQSINNNALINLAETDMAPGGMSVQDSHLQYQDFNEPTFPDSSLDLTQANIDSLCDDPSLEAAPSLIDAESEAPRVSAFAKLEFDDGEFYMNTYSVELGRDVRAARQASESHVQAVQRASGSSRKPSSSSGDASRASSKKLKRENGHRPASSIV